MQSAELKDVIPILDVRDVEAALRFYVERLGFQVDFRYEEDPNNYAGVRRGDVYLHMQWQHEDRFKSGMAGRLRVRVATEAFAPGSTTPAIDLAAHGGLSS
jgi:catechol 2,3-dioxygenase-like lactoylglutathione lyase family enzyme